MRIAVQVRFINFVVVTCYKYYRNTGIFYLPYLVIHDNSVAESDYNWVYVQFMQFSNF